jgi:transposase
MTLEESLALNEQLRKENEGLRRKIDRLTEAVERLTRQLDQLLARLGDAPNKTASPPGATPDADGAPSPSSSDSSPATPVPRAPPRRHAHGRGPMPSGLPVDIQYIEPDACCTCGGTIQRNGSVQNEVYDFVRAHVRNHRTVRYLGRCNRCGRRITPSLPPMPFERASCTFTMLTWVLYAKAALHLPLDRQRKEFNLQGATISTAMITRWFALGCVLLRIIVQQLRLDLLAGTHIRTDGTGLPVLDVPSKGKGRPATVGHVAVFCNPRIVVFHYSPDKKGEHSEDFLTLEMKQDGSKVMWEGTITADAESAHDRLFRDGKRIEAGCNAHGLRKFRDDADKAPLLTDAAMAYIGRFYDVDHEAKEKGLTGAELLAHRKLFAGPVATEFKAWLYQHIEDLVPQNPVRKAMQYYLNHWAALTRFLEDPKVPLDNNLSEGALRKLVVGRKNWLFAGGPEGALHVCDVLSIVETCKSEALDPFEYIAWVLPKLVSHPDNRGLKPSDLTPVAYKRTLKPEESEGFS